MLIILLIWYVLNQYTFWISSYGWLTEYLWQTYCACHTVLGVCTPHGSAVSMHRLKYQNNIKKQLPTGIEWMSAARIMMMDKSCYSYSFSDTVTAHIGWLGLRVIAIWYSFVFIRWRWFWFLFSWPIFLHVTFQIRLSSKSLQRRTLLRIAEAGCVTDPDAIAALPSFPSNSVKPLKGYLNLL